LFYFKNGAYAQIYFKGLNLPAGRQGVKPACRQAGGQTCLRVGRQLKSPNGANIGMVDLIFAGLKVSVEILDRRAADVGAGVDDLRRTPIVVIRKTTNHLK